MRTGSTYIFVGGAYFGQCKYVLVNILPNKNGDFNDIKSMDDIDNLSDTRKAVFEGVKFEITPEEEFMVHCSNLQAWAENDYDTRLLHSALSFPLLRALARLGDKKAAQVFSDDLVLRYRDANSEVRGSILVSGILDALSLEQIDYILDYDLKTGGHLDHGLEILRPLRLIDIKQSGRNSTCLYCGKHISSKARFCSRCGNKIEEKN